MRFNAASLSLLTVAVLATAANASVSGVLDTTLDTVEHTIHKRCEACDVSDSIIKEMDKKSSSASDAFQSTSSKCFTTKTSGSAKGKASVEASSCGSASAAYSATASGSAAAELLESISSEFLASVSGEFGLSYDLPTAEAVSSGDVTFDSSAFASGMETFTAAIGTFTDKCKTFATYGLSLSESASGEAIGTLDAASAKSSFNLGGSGSYDFEATLATMLKASLGLSASASTSVAATACKSGKYSGTSSYSYKYVVTMFGKILDSCCGVIKIIKKAGGCTAEMKACLVKLVASCHKFFSVWFSISPACAENATVKASLVSFAEGLKEYDVSCSAWATWWNTEALGALACAASAS